MSKKMMLRLDYNGAWDAGDNRHAQEIMHELGVTYEKSTPHTMADCWIFEGCQNVPDELPAFISVVR